MIKTCTKCSWQDWAGLWFVRNCVKRSLLDQIDLSFKWELRYILDEYL